MIESPLVKFFLGEGKQSARRQIRYSRHQRRLSLKAVRICTSNFIPGWNL